MPKLTMNIKGITVQGNRWDMDSVVFDPPVQFKTNEPFVVIEDTVITLKSTHSYMGVTTMNGIATMIAKEGAPIIRVVTPSGSFIEGEIEVTGKTGKLDVITIGKVKEYKSSKFERRIIK